MSAGQPGGRAQAPRRGRRTPLVAAAVALLLSGCRHGDAETAQASAAALVARVPLSGAGFRTARAQPARLKAERGRNGETYERQHFGR
ncbi:hypothetical protein ACFCYH_33370 [Streptomyces sp. NPDC056400]|uniref:hypothetical protein n=1 Tax=Streptomyces sp. NPDC056400 TaxID=3345808 RepID=UPI0035D55E41